MPSKNKRLSKTKREKNKENFENGGTRDNKNRVVVLSLSQPFDNQQNLQPHESKKSKKRDKREKTSEDSISKPIPEEAIDSEGFWEIQLKKTEKCDEKSGKVEEDSKVSKPISVADIDNQKNGQKNQTKTEEKRVSDQNGQKHQTKTDETHQEKTKKPDERKGKIEEVLKVSEPIPVADIDNQQNDQKLQKKPEEKRVSQQNGQQGWQTYSKKAKQREKEKRKEFEAMKAAWRQKRVAEIKLYRQRLVSANISYRNYLRD